MPPSTAQPDVEKQAAAAQLRRDDDSSDADGTVPSTASTMPVASIDDDDDDARSSDPNRRHRTDAMNDSRDVDVEKQKQHQLGAAAAAAAGAAAHGGPGAHPPAAHMQRQPSARFEKLVRPVYHAADEGGDAPLRPRRTFSRRDLHEASASAGADSAHPFGADLTRSRTETHLERFLSQECNKDVVVVHWEGDADPENPMNLSFAYKTYLTVFSAVLVLNSTFTSSCPSGVIGPMVTYFGFSQEVGILTISLWVAGYCLGPLVWGPMSERMGRRPVFIISIFAYTVWNVACALAKNTASILVFRFLGGVFGAAPLTNSGGLIADCWGPMQRGVALSFFSVAPFAGPALGPIISGAIAVTGTDWRWVFWVCAIFSGVCLAVTVFTVRETYAPVILRNKAKRIRKETNDERYKAPLEMHPLEAKTLLHDTLLFPFVMLVNEPILVALGLYLSFVYGLIYLQFESYPIIFQRTRGFNELIGGIMFIPLFLGGVVGCLFYVFFFNPPYTRKVRAAMKEGKRVPPEARLDIVCIAAPCLVISFFWIGWTGQYASISYWSPMMAGALLGFAVLLIFLGLFNYIVDAYLAKAASALAGNTVMRSSFGAAFPLFATQMYDKLGVNWASTLLGCLALLMLPIPFVLVRYGPVIRAKSKHAAE